MFLRSKSSSSLPCVGCQIGLGIILVLLVVSTIASIAGVIAAHFLPDGFVVGTPTSSLSLVALAFNLWLLKGMLAYCPCQYTVVSEKSGKKK